jgi:hypothetical protein
MKAQARKEDRIKMMADLKKKIAGNKAATTEEAPAAEEVAEGEVVVENVDATEDTSASNED